MTRRKPNRKAIFVSTPPQTLNIVLYGLGDKIAHSLSEALQTGSRSFRSDSQASATDCLNVLRSNAVDVVFANSKQSVALPLLRAMKQFNVNVPVVVVSEEPEFDEWLDAMEAGASDYCAAPFEPSQLRWILASHVHRQQKAA
jgi:DNA-binding NtrC family response regulator